MLTDLGRLLAFWKLFAEEFIQLYAIGDAYLAVGSDELGHSVLYHPSHKAKAMSETAVQMNAHMSWWT